MNALLNYPTNAINKALVAEGKEPVRYLHSASDFNDGVDWGKFDKDVDYNDPKQRQRFEDAVKYMVGRSNNDANYELPQKYRDEI